MLNFSKLFQSAIKFHLQLLKLVNNLHLKYMKDVVHEYVLFFETVIGIFVTFKLRNILLNTTILMPLKTSSRTRKRLEYRNNFYIFQLNDCQIDELIRGSSFLLVNIYFVSIKLFEYLQNCFVHYILYNQKLKHGK